MFWPRHRECAPQKTGPGLSRSRSRLCFIDYHLNRRSCPLKMAKLFYIGELVISDAPNACWTPPSHTPRSGRQRKCDYGKARIDIPRLLGEAARPAFPVVCHYTFREAGSVRGHRPVGDAGEEPRRFPVIVFDEHDLCEFIVPEGFPRGTLGRSLKSSASCNFVRNSAYP